MNMLRYKQGEVPPLTAAEKAELKALAQRPDSEIDCSDIPELNDGFLQRSVLWQDVVRSDLYKPRKVTVTAKIDADIVAWLKQQGRGYQTRMNAILRQTMLRSHQSGT